MQPELDLVGVEARAADPVAQVLLLPSPAGLPETLTYSIPVELRGQVRVGSAVEVPLAGREQLGYVLAVGPDSGAIAASRLKPVLRVPRSEPAFNERMLALLRLVSATTYTPLAETLPLAVPERHAMEMRSLIRLANPVGATSARLGLLTRQTLEAMFAALAAEGGVLTREALAEKVAAPNLPTVLRRARSEGWVEEHRVLMPPRVRARTLQAIRATGAVWEHRIHLLAWDGTHPPGSRHSTRAELNALYSTLRAEGGSATMEQVDAAVPAGRGAAVVRQARALGWVREERRAVHPDILPAEQPSEPGSVVRGDPGHRQREVVDRLGGGQPAVPVVALEVGSSTVDGLVRRGLAERTEVTVRRRPRGLEGAAAPPAQLTPDQVGALADIHAMSADNAGETLLIHGITGSGKTEIYLRAIEQTRAVGRTAILLVPEISLTLQVASAVRSRLGERVAMIHSGLSDGERFDEWERLRRGEADVVVGPRSALYAPMAEPGLIILDEEHDGSYKQSEPAPRYHARTIAQARARDGHGVVVLGSATPSVESYHAAVTGRYRLRELPTRVAGRSLPDVHRCDMRLESQRNPTSLFGRPLRDAIKARLAAREQVILFLNRRGFSPFLLCRECGHVPRCESCSVSLTLHRAGEGSLICHHCGHTRAAPGLCERCFGHKLKPFGLGTQRLEEATRDLFPTARIARLDRDSVDSKDAHARILSQMHQREIDILIGTQMVTKGFDFPAVTLVGVMAADISLHVPDFRAGERTFQLLAQVAGRAGRGDVAGQVILQTFDDDHPCIAFASHHDFHGFFRHEIEERRRAAYPPFTALARVLITDVEEAAAAGRAAEMRRRLLPFASAAGVQVLGPVACPLSRLRDRYRHHLLMRAPDETALHACLTEAWPLLRQQVGGATLDVDPFDLM